ncbi:MAG: DNA polymerase III subunit beta [candidate division SR1 bacterium]|nr:DNA polymerase III subunit beta [candidate division SR1 bacterium]
MKISIETAKLIDVIDIATRFVAKNATLPILQNIYFKASIDTLLLRATDMEKYIEIELPCTVKAEGAITVNAKMFSDIMKTIEEKDVEFSVDAKSQVMTIKSAKDNFEINGISASEYVALPEVPKENSITLDSQTFAEGIAKVEYAVTEKNFSPVLTGVLLKIKDEKIVFVGTDSFRLAEYKINTSIKDADFSLIVPKMTMNDIQKIAEYAIANESDEFQIQYSDNLIAFQVTIKDLKILATSLLIQGNFPEYDREEIMPKTFNTKVMVDKNLCEKAIRKIGILTRDINNYIQIETSKDSVIISSGKTDKGAGTTTIPAIIEGESVTLGINGKYITDFIRIIKGDEMHINIVDSQKPMILQDKDDASYRYVVRPLINS